MIIQNFEADSPSWCMLKQPGVSAPSEVMPLQQELVVELLESTVGDELRMTPGSIGKASTSQKLTYLKDHTSLKRLCGPYFLYVLGCYTSICCI